MGTFSNEKNLGKRLLNLKEELETKKAERQELQGELKSLIKQLKELGIDNVEQAEKELKSNDINYVLYVTTNSHKYSSKVK